MSKKYTYDFPMPSITADTVVLAMNTMRFLAITRKHDPYKGFHALPGDS